MLDGLQVMQIVFEGEAPDAVYQQLQSHVNVESNFISYRHISEGTTR